jgi:hypothetical protein
MYVEHLSLSLDPTLSCTPTYSNPLLLPYVQTSAITWGATAVDFCWASSTKECHRQPPPKFRNDCYLLLLEWTNAHRHIPVCTYIPSETTAPAYTRLKNQFITIYNFTICNFTSFARSTTGQMPALVILCRDSNPNTSQVSVALCSNLICSETAPWFDSDRLEIFWYPAPSNNNQLKNAP